MPTNILLYRSSVVRNRLLLVAAACVAWAGIATAQTATWTGTSSNLWSGTGNWSGTAPTNGSTLAYVFGGVGAANTSNTNDLTGLTASSVTFNGNGTYALSGNGITLGGTVTNTAGGNSIDLSLALAATRTFDVTAGSLTVNGVVSGAGGVTKSGGGTLGLFGSNSYTGVTTVNGGTLTVTNLANGGSNSSLGASSSAAANLILNGGPLVKEAAGSGTTDRLLTLSTGGGTLYAQGAPLNFTNTAAIAPSTGNDGNSTRSLTLRADTGVSTFAPQIVNGNGQRTVSLVKSGSATWALTNANTYTAGTTVSQGTLLVNNATGSGTGTGAVSVGSFGTLGGSGAIAGAVTVNINGQITAGTGTADPNLSLGGGLTLNSGARYNTRLFGTGAADISLINVTAGTTTINSAASLRLDLSALSVAEVAQLRADIGYGNTRTYTVMTGVGAANFNPANFVIDNLGNFPDANEWAFVLTPATGTVQLNFTPVPEPATVLGLAVAALGVGGVVRRRFRREAAAAV